MIVYYEKKTGRIVGTVDGYDQGVVIGDPELNASLTIDQDHEQHELTKKLQDGTDPEQIGYYSVKDGKLERKDQSEVDEIISATKSIEEKFNEARERSVTIEVEKANIKEKLKDKKLSDKEKLDLVVDFITK